MTTGRAGGRGFALACALVCLLAGCTGPAAPGRAGAGSEPAAGYGPGVDAGTRTITLLALVDLSGPGAGAQAPVLAAQQAYFARLDAGGGLGGWQVVLDVADTGGDPGTARRLFAADAGRVALVAQSYGGAVTAAIAPAARADGVLVGPVTDDARFQGGGYIAVAPPGEVSVANGLSYLATNRPGRLRVALVYPASPSGRQILGGYLRAVHAYRLINAATVGYPPGGGGPAAAAAAAGALAAAHAGYVFVAGPATVTAALATAAQRRRYRPGWLLDSDSWSPSLISAEQTPGGRPSPIAGELADTWVVADEAPWGAAAETGTAEFLRITAAYDPAQLPALGYIEGYCLADAERKILARALAAGGLTRAGISAAKRDFGQVDFGGLMADADYTPSARFAVSVNDVFAADPRATGLLRLLAPYFESSVAVALSDGAGGG